MLRTVGALIFGAIGDTYGRKWPYIINLSCLMVIQIGTGFVTTFQQFLGLRALFGVAMGGLFGICAAEALGDAPKRPEGVIWYFPRRLCIWLFVSCCFPKSYC